VASAPSARGGIDAGIPAVTGTQLRWPPGGGHSRCTRAASRKIPLCAIYSNNSRLCRAQVYTSGPYDTRPSGQRHPPPLEYLQKIRREKGESENRNGQFECRRRNGDHFQNFQMTDKTPSSPCHHGSGHGNAVGRLQRRLTKETSIPQPSPPLISSSMLMRGIVILAGVGIPRVWRNFKSRQQPS